MSQVALEAFLAKLYVDPKVREAFVADPRGTAMSHGLSHELARGLCEMDFEGLELAARSYEQKRSHKRKVAVSWLSRLRRAIQR